MSDGKSNNEQTPKGGSNPDRFKPIIIWLVVIGTLLGVWFFSDPRPRTNNRWTIKDVFRAVEEERVLKGSIKSEPTGGTNWTEVRVVLQESPTGEEQVYVARGRLTDDNLERLQETGIFEEVPASTLLTEVLVTLLPFVIIIGVLYFLFVRQLRMAGKGAMSFGKSRAKMLTREREKVSFKDVAGCDEAKEEVAEIVEFLRDPKKFQKIGGRIPKGVLLVGAPGTGKTLIARAVAGEAEVPFFSISGSDFVEMFVGVGAARVRDMFDQGRKSAPCIIFIDEIDAVGRQRGAGLGGGNDEREQTLNSLLVEMDGFDGHEGVIIVAATNRPDVLDSALLRPGRFDRQIVIDLPDLIGREAILKVHAKGVKVSKSVDFSVVARSCPGFSGADLANLLNEGALLAARYGKSAVDMADIDEAREKISFGRERRRLLDDDDKKITAYHEAGHALVNAVIDDGHLPLHKITIIPRGQSLGSTMFMPKKDILNHSRNHLLNQICWGMGGRVAEELAIDEITSGAAGDIKMVTKLARHMVCDWGMSDLGPVAFGENHDHVFLGKEISRNQNYSEQTALKIDQAITQIVEREHLRASEIVCEYRKALDTIADALIEYETIEGKHVHEILKYGEIRTPVLNNLRSPEPEEGDVPVETKKEEEVDDKGEEFGPGAEPAGVPA